MDALIVRCQSAELELIGKGHSPGSAQAAVRQALRWSRRIGSKVSPPIREQATLDLLEGRLREVEADYLSGLQAAPPPRERAESWAEGMRRFGATPGPETIAAYEQGAHLG